MRNNQDPLYHKIYVGWGESHGITSGIWNGRIVETQDDLLDILSTVGKQRGWPIVFVKWASPRYCPIMFLWQRSAKEKDPPRFEYEHISRQYQDFVGETV